MRLGKVLQGAVVFRTEHPPKLPFCPVEKGHKTHHQGQLEEFWPFPSLWCLQTRINMHIKLENGF